MPPQQYPSTIVPGGAAAFPGIRRPRLTAQAVFFSPVLLAAAIIHALCHPTVRRWLLAIMILDIPLQCGTHLGFRPEAALLGAIEGFDASITSVALCALYLGWIFIVRARHEELRFSIHLPIVVYTLVVAASWFVAADETLSLFEIVLLAQMLLFYIYIANHVRSRAEIERIVFILLAGALLESFLIVGMAATGHDFSFLRVLGIKTQIAAPGKGHGFTRQGGTAGSPNFTAAYLAMLVTLAVCVWHMQALRPRKKLAIAVFLMGSIALICTFSRGGWIEVVLSLAVLGGLRWRRGGLSRKTLATAVAGIVLAAAFLLVPNPISARVMGDDEGSAHSRVPLMHLALRIIEANPVLGIGANNFGTVMHEYAGAEFRHEWIYTVHNQFLLVCAETGIPGFLAFLWILGTILLKGWRLWKVGDSLFSPLALTILAAMCGLIAHMFVDIFSGRAILQLLWLFAALLAAMEAILRQERRAALLAQPAAWANAR